LKQASDLVPSLAHIQLPEETKAVKVTKKSITPSSGSNIKKQIKKKTAVIKKISLMEENPSSATPKFKFKSRNKEGTRVITLDAVVHAEISQ
jgi:hypothetical protein